MAAFGFQVRTLEVMEGDSVVVVGPGTKLKVIAAGELPASGARGRYVVFDPLPWGTPWPLSALRSTPATLDERRSA